MSAASLCAAHVTVRPDTQDGAASERRWVRPSIRHGARSRAVGAFSPTLLASPWRRPCRGVRDTESLAPGRGDMAVSTYTTDHQKDPHVATDGAGRFIVAWKDGYYYENIIARRYDSAGAALGGEFQVNTETIYDFTYGPKVAGDGSGNFVITWDGQGSGYYYVHGREFDSGGIPIAGQFRVDVPNDNDNLVMSRHSVAATAAGEFMVVWGGYRYSSYTYGVDGRQLGEAPVISTAAPKTGCLEPTTSGRGIFRFKKEPNPARSTLSWRWTKGQEVTPAHLGDPRTTNSFAFCVYDSSAAPQPLIDLAVPAGGGCGKLPCWRPIGADALRFDYFDLARFDGGIESVRVMAKPEGRGRALVYARKGNLALPTTPLTTPVTVQLQAANGTCWSAAYTTDVLLNAAGAFKARPTL